MKEFEFLEFVREKLKKPHFTFENFTYWNEENVGKV